MNHDEIKLVLDLIEQMYVGWDVDCNAQPDDELEKRALAFLLEHRGAVTGEHSMKSLAHIDRMKRYEKA